MTIANNPQQWPTDSEIYEQHLKRKKLEALEAGMNSAQKILSRYPDYGKASREYLASIAELLADFPADVLNTMADKHIGISARCKFLPTHADIIEYVEALHAKRHSVRDLRQGRVPEPEGPRKKFKPFPKLWAEFVDESTILEGHTFETLCDASKCLAMFGRQSAHDVLTRRVAA